MIEWDARGNRAECADSESTHFQYAETGRKKEFESADTSILRGFWYYLLLRERKLKGEEPLSCIEVHWTLNQWHKKNNSLTT